MLANAVVKLQSIIATVWLQWTTLPPTAASRARDHVLEPLSASEVLEVGPVALERLAAIVLYAVQKIGYGEKFCSNLSYLSSELLNMACYLDGESPGLNDDPELWQRIQKMLLDIEGLLEGRLTSDDRSFPRLQALTSLNRMSKAYKEERDNICAVLLSVDKTGVLEVHARRINLFNGSRGIKGSNTELTVDLDMHEPADSSTQAKRTLYDILKQTMQCTCAGASTSMQHMLKLLLEPVPEASPGHVFEFLISSSPPLSTKLSQEMATGKSAAGSWQTVCIAISEPRVKISESTSVDTASRPDKPPEQIDKLCDIICVENHARLCFKVVDKRLLRDKSKPLPKKTRNAPGTPLSSVIDHLEPVMKQVLAYILVESMWHYYNTSWTGPPWTADTIQLMEQRQGDSSTEYRLFFWRPYLPIDVLEYNRDSWGDYSPADLHPCAHLCALGVLLVEIALGRKIVDNTTSSTYDLRDSAKRNLAWHLAQKHLAEELFFDDFPYYKDVVAKCLDPDIFPPPVAGSTDKERQTQMDERLDIIYTQIVSPVRNVVTHNGWLQQLRKDAIQPLKVKARREPVKSTVSTEAPIARTSVNLVAKWFQDVEALVSQLESIKPENFEPTPINIVVLDTGLDPNSSFLDDSKFYDRLREWKDFAGSCDQRTDEDGHGTHLVSVIMRIAPHAVLHVARVAANSKSLHTDDGKARVAQAIDWAVKTCKADIVSMSFGFVDDVPSIDHAIDDAQRSKNVVFFAAANNKGANERELFPARHARVISMRATNTFGKFCDFNAPKEPGDEYVLGTLGTDVPGDSLGGGGLEERKGSSVATAIAAGLAGTLLRYVSLKTREASQKEVMGLLTTHRGMVEMLRSPALSFVGDSKAIYIAPRKLMGSNDKVRWAKFESLLDVA